MLSNALRKETLPAPSFFVIFLLKFPYMREYMRETAANFSPPSAHLPRHAPLTPAFSCIIMKTTRSKWNCMCGRERN